ncbi:NAD(+) diphosphatase [Colwellia sp. E2M01]|uniref:NAD(+) diphosphatase n=1 Tax=Colwellia sp. E2M01 TaxID=2841561 RepID=UPI001C07F404|nr:NAD(+) diphosphatase [Colwellia sp. E2M01]MBU2871934.1 NAD(+) diphosphatase [Colwellia sp. E2M01]
MTFAYADMPLDRCTNQRKNKSWLKTEFNNDNTLFCVINDGMGLFATNGIIAPIYLTKGQLPTLSVDSCIYLGKGDIALSQAEITDTNAATHIESNKAVSIFTVDFNKLRFSTQEELTEIGQWQPLKAMTPNLSPADASILALAKGMVHWHISHQFCGLCGNHSRAVEAGHARRCNDCRNMSFPRTDPAVIMLVEKMFADGIPRCLLGRQASWEKGVYSTLAGFVDPGESLEQAVIREVAEESGIVVENPKYCSSQPWPFPASIMLGFTAVAKTDAIDVTHDALEDAQWFSREQLSNFGVKSEVGEQNNEVEFKISSSSSISAYLIKAWKNKEIGQY